MTIANSMPTTSSQHRNGTATAIAIFSIAFMTIAFWALVLVKLGTLFA